MSDYVRTEQTVKRIRYELRAPTCGAELDTALHAASRSFHEMHARAPGDDELRVTAEDELIVVWFEAAS